MEHMQSTLFDVPRLAGMAKTRAVPLYTHQQQEVQQLLRVRCTYDILCLPAPPAAVQSHGPAPIGQSSAQDMHSTACVGAVSGVLLVFCCGAKSPLTLA